LSQILFVFKNRPRFNSSDSLSSKITKKLKTSRDFFRSKTRHKEPSSVLENSQKLIPDTLFVGIPSRAALKRKCHNFPNYSKVVKVPENGPTKRATPSFCSYSPAAVFAFLPVTKRMATKTSGSILARTRPHHWNVNAPLARYRCSERRDAASGSLRRRRTYHSVSTWAILYRNNDRTRLDESTNVCLDE
jgi:hypothetical protein